MSTPEEAIAHLVDQQLGDLQAQVRDQVAEIQVQYQAQAAHLQAEIADLHICLQQQALPPAPVVIPPAVPAPKPPKVAAPTAYEGGCDNLDRFKAKCNLYLNMCGAEFRDDQARILFILSYMKGETAGPWATQQINTLLNGPNPVIPTYDEFLMELDGIFADPNQEASARHKLSTIRQGPESVEEVIKQFEIHGPQSGYNEAGLIDQFEKAIHPCLQETIYRIMPMPESWGDWKAKASVLDNQWRHFQGTQTKSMPTRQTTAACPTTTTHVGPTSATPTTPSTSLQLMEVDRTRQARRDPHSGVCFNCGRPGHVTCVCPEPHSQRIRGTETATTPSKLSPSDFQILVENMRSAIAPTTSPHESLELKSNTTSKEDF